MVNIIPIVIFAVITIAIGIGGLFFPYHIEYIVIKLIGKGDGLLSVNKHEIERISGSDTIRTMKISGIVSLLMGLFSLWVIWKKLRQ